MALHWDSEPDLAASLKELPAKALVIRVPGPYAVSALVDGTDTFVVADPSLVADGRQAVLGARVQSDMLALDLRRLGSETRRVVVSALRLDVGRQRSGALTVDVAGADGVLYARFTVKSPRSTGLLPLAEIFRSEGSWWVRAWPLPGREQVGAAEGEAQPPQDSMPALMNAVRLRLGVPPLSADVRLDAAARAHAAAMAARETFDQGTSGDVSLFDRVTGTGYRYLSIVEHVASGPRDVTEFAQHCLSVERTVRAWGDPDVSHFGFGHSPRGQGELFWTAVWARQFSTDGLARILSQVVVLTNAERAAAGLPAVIADTHLTVAAQAHSADMAARRFYSHTSPEGWGAWDRAVAAGYPHQGVGENIACGQRSAAEVVCGWMNSPDHCANMLRRDFTCIGVGYATGGRAGTYWTQMFGTSG
ncbi:uncharacterized protein YkwD [Streptomyces sp. V4I23]|uniref:CAP domain-containing protein n=1 Tax=Streptomyces sp. V4I23 TaxID=3042282 RepID=UPI0027818CC1|nr:CAP domain-containing protein [Streptomyces sp. V4I23]MDQ1005943.1 uncharacterized protein YkwD [Streptomyces sp. V4I23]